MFILKKIGPISGIVIPTTYIFFSASIAHAQALLPSDPTVITGEIAFSLPDAGQMGIDQTSSTGIINWGSFSIGSGNTVTIQNGTGATLNRVTGNDPSQILGTLDATGSVYLLNQNGVFFGKDGVIQTGGDFVASTLDITNADFLNGGDTVFKGDSSAGVLNFGKIGSLGGNVALIARTVVNEGSISAPNGTAALIAGREILMRDIALDNGMFVVRVGGEDTSVTDKGSIAAATAELRANGGNIYALAGNTSGTIRATGVKKKGGRVFLTAGGGTVKTTKTISARRSNGAGGSIIVNAANIEASNLYDASAASGKGGFVELFATAEAAFSGQILAYGDDVPGMGGFAEVSGVQMLSYTGSTNTGGGTLLLDPNNIQVLDPSDFDESGPIYDPQLDNASIIDGDTLENEIESNNVIIQTSGTEGQSGTILVEAELLYDSAFDLTFLAHGDILLRAPVQNENTAGGDLNFVAGWDGSTSTLTFDANPFLDADLDNPVIFGNSNGMSYTLGGSSITASGIFSMQAFQDVSVGSATGDTQVFANSVEISALTSGGTSFKSILGARVNNNTTSIGTFPITGDIVVRATDQILVSGGTNSGGFGQIGHVGSAVTALGAASTSDVNAEIFVEAGGDIILRAGNDNATYAMIGHGSFDDCEAFGCNQSEGTRQGNISVFAGDELSIDDELATAPGGVVDVFAVIGHGTGTADGVSNADIVVEADRIDDDSFVQLPIGSTSTFDGDLSYSLQGGSLTISVLGSGGLAFGNNTTIDAVDGELILSTAGNLQFGSGSQIVDSGSNGEYAFSAGGDLFILPGDDFFDIGDSQWVVYSSSPVNNTGDINSVDGLAPDVIVYGREFDIDNPFLTNVSGITALDNTLVYSVDPQLMVDPLAFTYGQDATAVPNYTFTVNGTELDPVDFGFNNLSFTPNTSVITTSSDGFINVGTYTGGVTTIFDAPEGSSIVVGSGFDGIADLTVSPATINVQLLNTNTTYTGNTQTAVDTNYLGWVGTDGDNLINGTATFSPSEGNAIDAGTYTIEGSGETESSGNYVFDETDTALLTINPATIEVQLSNTSTTYSGIQDLNVNVTYEGFLGEDDDSLINGTATFSPNAGNAIDAGTYTIEGSGETESSGNYVFDETDTALLTINPATLTVLLADETKNGSGYTGEVTYTGFVNGEQDTLITSGPAFSYTGNDGSAGQNPGDYTVDGSGATESSGNYIFDETDTASLTILVPVATETEEPTRDLPEVPRDQNPSSIGNRAVLAPTLVNALDSLDGEGFVEVSTINTDQLVNQLQRGKQFCEGLAQSEYVIDCMGDSLQKAADGLPDGGDYAEVRAALEDASAKLAALARQNASTTLTRGLVQSNGQQSTRRFTPVATEALAALNAQASAIIEEAQTVLLRSAQNSERRKVHYQRIAEAVGSNKILLRS